MKQILFIVGLLAAGISTMAFTNTALALGPDSFERQAKVDDRLDPLTKSQRLLHKKEMDPGSWTG